MSIIAEAYHLGDMLLIIAIVHHIRILLCVPLEVKEDHSLILMLGCLS